MENFFEVKNVSKEPELSELQSVNRKIEEFAGYIDRLSSLSEEDKDKLLGEMYNYHYELEKNPDLEIRKQAPTLMSIIYQLDPIIIG